MRRDHRRHRWRSAPTGNLRDTRSEQTARPWKHNTAAVTIADRVVSPGLAAGCGTGNTALFFAALGHRVTGIDFVDEAIRQARAKAAERGLTAEFLIKDAVTLGEWDRRFASAIDSGLFHVYAGDERRCYLRPRPRGT